MLKEKIIKICQYRHIFLVCAGIIFLGLVANAAEHRTIWIILQSIGCVMSILLNSENTIFAYRYPSKTIKNIFIVLLIISIIFYIIGLLITK